MKDTNIVSISVVIITRNRIEKLKRCIESVVRCIPEADIVVVDNHSDDASLFLKSSGKNIQTIFLKKNVGVAKARNIGVAKTASDIIILLDDDAWIEKIDIAKISAYFRDNPTTGIIAPHILYPAGGDQESARSLPTLLSAFWRGSLLYKLFPDVSWYIKYISHDYKNDHVVDWAIGACQIIRSEVFKKIGMLDERYFFGYEDVDFCFRARRAGYFTFYIHEIMVKHEYARTSARGINLNLFRHCYGICRFFYKRLVAGKDF